MTEQLRVEMMSRKAILWRCLHGGSLTADSIEKKNDEEAIPRLEFRTRNISSEGAKPGPGYDKEQVYHEAGPGMSEAQLVPA